MILYGIPTCDTCRKARKALEGAGHAVEFHDIRAQPLAATDWAPLIEHFGADILNRKSAAWRALGAPERLGAPLDLLLANPTLMKRPLIREGGRLTIGWDDAARAHWGL